MKPGQAVLELTRLGFRFRLDGEAVKLRFVGQDKPDPGQVVPLLEAVKAHKGEVRNFLRIYCPRCGGVCFCPDLEGQLLCLKCDWERLMEIYPALRTRQ